jgi:hypothetical protein
VRVSCADGSAETGSHAIVTVPLGILKRGSPRFDPPLPAPMRDAIAALGFGSYEKIALRFETVFWREDGMSHVMVYPADDDEPVLWVFDLDAFGAGPVLCAHPVSTTTHYALDRSQAEAATWFAELLADVVGHSVPEPTASVVTSWSRDPFAVASTPAARWVRIRGCLSCSLSRCTVGCCWRASTPRTSAMATRTAPTPAASGQRTGSSPDPDICAQSKGRESPLSRSRSRDMACAGKMMAGVGDCEH